MRSIQENLRKDRFLLVRRREHLHAGEEDRLQALLESPTGADLRIARYFLTEGCDPDLDEDYPNWRLMEVDANGQLTGRGLDSLHESILTLDPSGRDGHPDDISGDSAGPSSDSSLESRENREKN